VKQKWKIITEKIMKQSKHAHTCPHKKQQDFDSQIGYKK